MVLPSICPNYYQNRLSATIALHVAHSPSNIDGIGSRKAYLRAWFVWTPPAKRSGQRNSVAGHPANHQKSSVEYLGEILDDHEKKVFLPAEKKSSDKFSVP